MSHICDVAYVAHLVADVLEVAEQQVEGNSGSGVTQVSIAIDGWAADIHAHAPFHQWAEELLLAGKGVIE
jgi:hypothetical protein